VRTFRTHCVYRFSHSQAILCLESTHIVHIAPLFRLGLRAGNSSETREEPLGHGVDGVHPPAFPKLPSRWVESALRTSMPKPRGGLPHPQHVAPQGCVLIGLRLPDVLFLVRDSISLLVCPSPIAIGFSLCLQSGRGDGSLSHLWIEVATAPLKVKIERRSSGKVRRGGGDRKRVRDTGITVDSRGGGGESLYMKWWPLPCASEPGRVHPPGRGATNQKRGAS
jgi:hypothetical protein